MPATDAPASPPIDPVAVVDDDLIGRVADWLLAVHPDDYRGRGRRTLALHRAHELHDAVYAPQLAVLREQAAAGAALAEQARRVRREQLAHRAAELTADLAREQAAVTAIAAHETTLADAARQLEQEHAAEQAPAQAQPARAAGADAGTVAGTVASPVDQAGPAAADLMPVPPVPDGLVWHWDALRANLIAQGAYHLAMVTDPDRARKLAVTIADRVLPAVPEQVRDSPAAGLAWSRVSFARLRTRTVGLVADAYRLGRQDQDRQRPARTGEDIWSQFCTALAADAAAADTPPPTLVRAA